MTRQIVFVTRRGEALNQGLKVLLVLDITIRILEVINGDRSVSLQIGLVFKVRSTHTYEDSIPILISVHCGCIHNTVILV